MKPVGPIFDTGWRKNSALREVSLAEVSAFVQAHYLKKRPAIVLLSLGIFSFEKLVGMVLYSAPPKQSDVRYGGKTWELARLYLLDEVPKNAETWAISGSVKHIRKNYPDVYALVSYADPSAGHSGTIYRAANWVPDGRTDENRKTPRCDYVDARTGKRYGRRGNVPADACLTRVPRVSKFRFKLLLKKNPCKSPLNISEKTCTGISR
jgi:hypothetical protein